MKWKTLAAGLIAATGLVVVGASTTSATYEGDQSGACYTEVTQHRYEKFTQTRTRTYSIKDGWSEWSPYDELVDWPGIGPRDWGDVPDPMSGDHDGPEGNNPLNPDNYNDRRFEYRIVATRTVKGERIPCTESPAVPDYTPPTCDEPGQVNTIDTPTYHWTATTSDEGVTVTAVANDEWTELVEPTVFGPYVVDQLTGEQCTPETTEPPVTTEPPTTTEPPVTTEPPTTTEPPVTTEPPTTTAPPATSTTQPPTTPAPTTTTPGKPNLPVTGGNGATMSIVALGLLAAGTALVAASRRQQATD